MNTRYDTPLLPDLFAVPLHRLPAGLKNTLVGSVLNRLFHAGIEDGSLDFLVGRAIGVEVTDARLRFHVQCRDGRLVVGAGVEGSALQLAGTLHDFLLLASRREDADTLFFQRRLKMQGDTEIGLELKNFLDSMDLESHPMHRHVDRLLRHGTSLYERLFAPSAGLAGALRRAPGDLRSPREQADRVASRSGWAGAASPSSAQAARVPR